MNLADGIILFVIVVSALLSVRRGFTREAFSLLTWVAAFIIARLFSPALDLLLQEQISTPSPAGRCRFRQPVRLDVGGGSPHQPFAR